MLQSRLFSKTSKEAPKEEISINAKLLEQAGYIQKVLAGVYTFLPLGIRVLHKIENIVRDEMNKIGTEILMPSLAPKENWEKTGRWNELDVLFKLKSQHGFEYALGPTHEEIVSPAAGRFISSYRDLPTAVYQIQTKFRDEPRAKSGLMRGREFRMKDLYSFHASQQDLDEYYEKSQRVYLNLFKRMGLDAILTEASGGTFSKFSHELQVVVPTGEDTIFVCEKCNALAKNKEIFTGAHEQCTNCGKTTWREEKGAEVGNIFKLGTKYSAPFNLNFTDENGKEQQVLMGCYGLGTSRLMGVIAEVYNDKNGLIWPENVAPFSVHLIALQSRDADAQQKVWHQAQQLYKELQENGVDVLFDDRQESAGVKFADSDLIGIPHRLVVSEKTLAQDGVEWKERAKDKTQIIKTKEILQKLKTTANLKG